MASIPAKRVWERRGEDCARERMRGRRPVIACASTWMDTTAVSYINVCTPRPAYRAGVASGGTNNAAERFVRNRVHARSRNGVARRRAICEPSSGRTARARIRAGRRGPVHRRGRGALSRPGHVRPHPRWHRASAHDRLPRVDRRAVRAAEGHPGSISRLGRKPAREQCHRRHPHGDLVDQCGRHTGSESRHARAFGPVAPARRVRAERNLRRLEQERNAHLPTLGTRELVRHACHARIRKLSRPARGRDAASGHGHLPQPHPEPESRSRAQHPSRRELRARSHAAVLGRTRAARPRRHAAVSAASPFRPTTRPPCAAWPPY